MSETLPTREQPLRIVRIIPDADSHGSYNREVVIEATKHGLEIDEYILIPWAWIQAVFRNVGADSSRSSEIIERGILDVPEWGCKIPFELRRITLTKTPQLIDRDASESGQPLAAEDNVAD